jgi:hypothetical protein
MAVNSAIELHDSVISQIHEIGPTVVIEFSPAYVHKSPGKPGVDTGTGWLQSARLTITGAVVSGESPPLPESLWGGSLSLATHEYDILLKVPLNARGQVELNLEFASGQTILVSGEAIALELIGEAQYLENFDASNLTHPPDSD